MSGKTSQFARWTGAPGARLYPNSRQPARDLPTRRKIAIIHLKFRVHRSSGESCLKDAALENEIAPEVAIQTYRQRMKFRLPKEPQHAYRHRGSYTEPASACRRSIGRFARDNSLLCTRGQHALRILVYDPRLCGGVTRYGRENLDARCHAATRVIARAETSADRGYLGTTNLLERLFVEERRRLKIIPIAFGERAVLKLMCSVRSSAPPSTGARSRSPSSNIGSSLPSEKNSIRKSRQ